MTLLGCELADVGLVATIVNLLGVDDVKYSLRIDAATSIADADVLIRIVGYLLEIGDRLNGIAVVDGVTSCVEQPKPIEQFVDL